MAEALQSNGIAYVPVSAIRPSPTNPRKTFHGIEELAENLRVRGVLQPVMLRPHGQDFELVFGERRWRAAKVAKLETLPAMVRDLSDKDVLEIQIIENGKREDVPPLEEAEGYRTLVEKHGYTPDDIAAKVGKSKRVVYERIQLCKLGKEGRKALDEGRLNASVALLVARIPGELQAAAVKDVAAEDEEEYSGLSYRRAVEHIHQNYMLQLKDAPFSLTDAALVAKAGACSTCPKRTGNQPELFADVKAKDVCTDPKCYRSKEDALWQIKVKEAEASGQKVLGAAETKKVFPYEHTDTPAYGSPFVALDQEEWTGGKHVKVKTLLGKDAPPPVLARTPSGKVVELTSRELVQKKLKELQPGRSIDSFDGDGQAKFRRRQILRGKVCAAGLTIIADRAELDEGGRKTLAFIAESLFHGGYYDGTKRAAKRREIEVDKLEKDVPKMTAGGLAGLIVEVVAGDNAPGGSWGGGYGGRFNDACKVFGVDVKKLEAAAKAAGKAKKPAPGKACAIPGCGAPGKRAKGAPGLWCEDHGSKLSAVEKKSIAERAKRLGAPAPAKAKGGKRKRGK